MKVSSKIVATSSLLLLSLLCNAAIGESIEERKWIRMASEHFTIHSALSEKKTTSLLKNLEVIHALFLGIAQETAASAVPTTIFAVADEDFETLGMPPQAAGVFSAGLRRNFIVIRNTSQMDAAATIVHEYVHYLLTSLSRFPYPAWFHEGYAEFLSTSELKGKYFDVGKGHRFYPYMLATNTRLPTATILDSSQRDDLNEDEMGMFYAQSWLLVHYLYSRPGRESALVEDMTQYGLALRDGASEIEAFERGFDISVKELEDHLDSYRKRGKYHYLRYPTKPMLVDFKPERRMVDRYEISVILGELILESQLNSAEPDAARLSEARRLFDIGLDSPKTQARAEIGIAYLLEHNEQADMAEEFLISGASLAADNYFVQLDAAKFYANRLLADGYIDGDVASKVGPYLIRAAKLDNTQPELAFTLGQMLLATGEDPERGLDLLKTAALRAPASNPVRMFVAAACLQLGRYDEAIAYAEDLLHFAHGTEAGKRAAQDLIATARSASGRKD